MRDRPTHDACKYEILSHDKTLSVVMAGLDPAIYLFA
jgi:hypothetical protein